MLCREMINYKLNELNSTPDSYIFNTSNHFHKMNCLFIYTYIYNLHTALNNHQHFVDCAFTLPMKPQFSLM